MTNPINLIPNFNWRFALAMVPFLLLANCNEPANIAFKALDWSVAPSK